MQLSVNDLPSLEEIEAERIRRRAHQEGEILARDVGSSRARCATLYGFVQEAWHILEPVEPFIGGWAVQAICEHLEAIADGRIRRLLINCPPGFAKSLLVSVFFPAWLWGPGGKPSTRILSTSHEEGLSVRDNLRMRRLIVSPWYQARWGEVCALTQDQTAKMRFENKATGWRECAAFTGLPGRRGDLVIVDDPNTTKTMESDVQRAEAARTFMEDIPSRVNNERSAIVVIQQRLHEGDVSGVILSRKLGYVHLCLPMEFEPDRRCETEIGFRDPRTYEGELLAPERQGRNAVEELKRSLLAYGTAGQLQQRPSPREGALFKIGKITIIDALPATIHKRVRAWDFAASRATPGRDPDYTAGVKVSRDEVGFLYVEDVVRDRWSANDVKVVVKATASRDTSRTRVRLPQDPGQAGKAQAEDFVRALVGYPVTVLPVTGDKVTRAMPAASQVEAGNVFLVRGDWNETFLAELATFPAGSHDDQVDAFADAINQISSAVPGENLLQYMHEEGVKARAESAGVVIEAEVGDWVRLRAPPNIGAAYGRDGSAYTPGPDGVMRVHPDDAPLFLSQIGWERA